VHDIQTQFGHALTIWARFTLSWPEEAFYAGFRWFYGGNSRRFAMEWSDAMSNGDPFRASRADVARMHLWDKYPEYFRGR